MKKDLTSVRDLSREDVEFILKRAINFKEQRAKGARKVDELGGKVVAMVFEKPSLRTKVAFEVAAASLGGTAVFLSSSQILASGNNERGRESIPDIARNLERFCDLIVARVYEHSTITAIAESVAIPTINALCDKHHPTQALADLMAIRWHKPGTKRLRVAYVGDGNNVATSLMEICALTGLDFAIATPSGFEIPPAELSFATWHSKVSGSALEFYSNPIDAIAEADVVYTDTWVSMGQEAEKLKRIKQFDGFCVTRALLSHAKPDAVFMHCLPAHRGEEVVDEVFDSKQSIVFDQAECRLHIAKALISILLQDSRKV